MTAKEDHSASIRVAVTQAEPVWLNLEKTVDKTCRLIEDAAKNKAKLVTFPECWIPGYPAWIWCVARHSSCLHWAKEHRTRSIDFELGTLYQKNSLKINSPEMQRICDSAAQNKIAVALGFSENHNH
jgi:nitrilase